ncbi:uncharacterized protein BDZ99DRAFT_487179 [Mytilinidion resinicola]|uniref:Alpha/beta hydrolase fold-3 domain-containing protein n=1 Tax=Mytilinidion resinicola TaxID=574789 RepID=A0A6A6YS29_9PEZI|nr:uncharacterized protein BDZ99DRAFT_487179 [Mytilinidion resinicola]KAF2811358.1 hypothetical protein BDZ99DRAFT_487179 [Mytilinidion resinicola]
MPLPSDLQIDVSKFDPTNSNPKTEVFNKKLIHIAKDGPRWYEVGAAKYRQMRWNGETPLPKPVVIESGVNGTIPSRDPGRELTYRLFNPEKGEVKGIYMHIHGGGWVLQSEAYQDGLLKYMADNTGLAVVSIGYRLAPEDPWPAGAEDCYDFAEYLVEHGKERFGGELMFTGGESAGGHFAALVSLYLLKSKPNFAFRGLLLHFGCFDLSGFLPMVDHHERGLVIDHDIMKRYIDVLLPNTTIEQRRHPSISPFFADLRGLKLPPALFTCGTEDPLLDDTVFMSAKWMMWGNEAVVRIYNGAPHGFIMFPPGTIDAVQEGLDASTDFVKEKLG